MAEWYIAPSLMVLREELNKKYPKRDRRSDGGVGDLAHQARVSDHNPDWAAGGVVRAIDIDKDGIDVQELLDAVIGNARVQYVIFNRRIYNAKYGWAARAYTGINAHMAHIHVSLRHTRVAERSTAPWLKGKITKSEELTGMDVNDKWKLTERDAEIWNEWAGEKKYKEGTEVSVSEMLRYPTLLKRMHLEQKKFQAEVRTFMKNSTKR